MLQAKNGCLRLPDGEMDYICFGSGSKPLVLLPGVGDGLKTVRGMALPFALLYRELAREFRVYVFSRRRELPAHFSTREMAADQSRAMELLNLRNAAVVGVSQGGMIAQWLAIDYPEQLGKLVLTVTAGRPNDTVRQVIGHWMDLAGREDYAAIMLDTAERSYSPRRLRQARFEYKLLGRMGKPKSFARFVTQAESCLNHDAYAELDRICCPTLVIGGGEDRIVTWEASREIAGRIPGATLHCYERLGHSLYEEAPDFLTRVADFCR